MKDLEIREINANNYWIVFIRDDVREAVTTALNKQECVNEVVTANKGSLVVHISARAEQGDMDELRGLLVRLTATEGVDKPKRHPILDEHWRQCEDRSIRDARGIHVGWHAKWGDQIALLPDLLREVLAHVEEWNGTGHDRIGEILNNMGIDAKAKIR